MPATKENEAEFEARMQSDLNRILAETKSPGTCKPADSLRRSRRFKCEPKPFLEQAEIHRRARKGWIGALSCIPWPIQKSNSSTDPIHGQQMAQILSRNPPFEQEIHSAQNWPQLRSVDN